MTTTKIAIVAAEFNRELVDAMVVAARDEAGRASVEISREIRIPGCFEMPLLVSRLLARADLAAVVVLGHIERGETLHGEMMGHVVTRALVDVQLATGKPIGIGIIGPGATKEQAQERRDAHARAAVRAVVA
nr:6,7-dimethyl-8-ribityllumazine synthase [Deltaproteobacteria bacterium]